MVPLDGDLGRAARPVTPNVGACPPPAVAGERSGLEEAVVGRLVEPGDAAAAASPGSTSRDDLQLSGLHPTRTDSSPAASLPGPSTPSTEHA